MATLHRVKGSLYCHQRWGGVGNVCCICPFHDSMGKDVGVVAWQRYNYNLLNDS